MTESTAGHPATGAVPPRVEYLTTDEVATWVRSPAETVRYWHAVGRGPRSVKVGRRRLYRRADVEAWLDAQYDSQGPGAA
jgi:excisionase family DNA binding protein